MDKAEKSQAQGAPLDAASFFGEERLRVPPKSPAPKNGNFRKPPPDRLQTPPKSSAPAPRREPPALDSRLQAPPKSPAPLLEATGTGARRRPRIPVFQRSYSYQGRLARAAFRALDLAGEALFAKTREKPGEVRRVLLMRLDRLGDVVCALPAVRALRERLPDAHIDLLIGSSARPLVAGLEKELAGVDFLVFNASWLQRPGRRKFGLRSAVRLRQLLRLRMREIGGPYDLAVDFRGDFQSIAAARLAGARYLVGRGLRGFGFGLDAEVGEIPGRHQVERNLDLLECAGLGRFETKSPRLALSEEEMAQAWACVSSLPEYDAKVLIGIHPGAGSEERIWRPELYGELIRRLVSGLSARVLVLGGAADREVVGSILGSIKGVRARGSVVDMCERVQDLRSLMGVMKCCRLYISNDSGPTHVAAALGVPSICVFQGPHEPGEWGPRGSNVVVLRKRPASGSVSRAGEEGRELDYVFEAARRCV